MKVTTKNGIVITGSFTMALTGHQLVSIELDARDFAQLTRKPDQIGDWAMHMLTRFAPQKNNKKDGKWCS